MSDDNEYFPIGTATISWVDSKGNSYQRVYSTDGYKAIEWAKDAAGNWTQTDFSAPAGQISATVCVIKDEPFISVICTTQNKTSEWCQSANGAWEQGAYVYPPKA